jgi:alpha-glucoside transport system permease protein
MTTTEPDREPTPSPEDAQQRMPAAAENLRVTQEVRREGLVTRSVRFVTSAPVAILLAIVAFLWMLPTVGLLISSLRTPADNARTGWWAAIAEPTQLTIESYRSLLQNEGMMRAFVNTVLISVPSSVLLVLVAALAAYAFAWMRFPGRDALFLVVVALLVVPIQVALIPVARLYGNIGIYGSLLGVILFHLAFGLPFAIFLLRNFFIGIPHELLEAARMDGAGEWRVFSRVVLPLGIPAIASLLIFQFLWVWNDLLVALVFAGSDARPLTAAIREQLRSFGANIDIIASGAFLQMAVPIIVFLAFQRYFVQGLLAGSQR